jgi:uncharacterized HAD superfamily protein
MRFFVDIDQTISSGQVLRSLQESVQYYQNQGVNVPETVTCYPDLFQLPEVVRMHEMLPGAQSGVSQLAQVGELMYATVRKPEVEEMTRIWLQAQGFPSPEKVIFTQSMAHKVLALSAFSGPLILIDDRWQKALEVWPRLVDSQPEMAHALATRLTLVAFGASADDLPADSPLSIVAFPDWSWVEALIQHFTVKNDVVCS